MNKIVLFLATCFALPVLAQEEPIVAIHSFEDTSCAAWTKSADDKFVRAQYGYWFRGFVSGYNFGRPDNQVALSRLPDMDTVALYVDKYCRENPLKPFVGAAFDLVKELRDHEDRPLAKSPRHK